MKIKHLKLDCANLDEQKYFYTRKFKFKVVEEGNGEITLQVGDSLLTFVENRLKKPYYHFAFNIPYGTVESAVKWVHKKVDVISFEGKEIQEFEDWKARAFYFLDPAGNVVELIGRKRFDDFNGSSFSESKILNISEIGLPVFEVSSAFTSINKACGVPEFGRNDNVFLAAGNDEGLFIIVDKAEKTWFPTDEPARAYHMEVNFKQGEERYILKHASGEMSINKIEKSPK